METQFSFMFKQRIDTGIGLANKIFLNFDEFSSLCCEQTFMCTCMLIEFVCVC